MSVLKNLYSYTITRTTSRMQAACGFVGRADLLDYRRPLPLR